MEAEDKILFALLIGIGLAVLGIIGVGIWGFIELVQWLTSFGG
jgi:hypothetical protein